MGELKRELTHFMEEIDGVLYYDEEKLQHAIESEMREEGRKEEIEEGIHQANIEIAKSLLKSNMPVEEVSKHTKLSIEEVTTLKDEK